MSKFGVDQIHVLSIRAYYDTNTGTKVNENDNLLQYETQHFRCKVNLRLKESIANRNWSIGLVQACDGMYLENKYGEIGSSFWEFHPLGSERHKMVNDSDGRQYPFYSLSSSKFEVKRGLVRENVIRLHYQDHFYPTVAWELPYCGGVQLTEVIRRQSFWVWLVAIKRAAKGNVFDHFNVQEDNLFVLRTIRWRYNLHLTFDPCKTVGQRLKVMNDTQTDMPYVLESNRAIPISAITPPHCNAAQSLIWYPKSTMEKPKILVPPRQIIVPWDSWLRDMMPMRLLNVQKPKDCNLVGEWSRDQEIGSPLGWMHCPNNNPFVRSLAKKSKRRRSMDVFGEYSPTSNDPSCVQG